MDLCIESPEPGVDLMTPDRLRVLEEVELFRGLREEALKIVAERTVRKRTPAKSILFRRGESCKGVYFVIRGRFEVYRSGDGGKTQVLHVAREGETLGEVPLLDGGPYPASVRASADGEVLFLSCHDFQWLYRNRPEIAEAVIRDLGRRLRELVGLVETISLRDVPQRVARMILERAREAEALRPGGVVKLDRTQAEIASELSTTREGVARGLARLAEMGAIQNDGPWVEILDPELLREASGE